LTSRQTISTLPPGFAGSNFSSEILVSADGRFVYAGNRLHDSIAIFSIGSNGTLTWVGEEWSRGNYPRSFAFDPRAAFSIAAISGVITSPCSVWIEKLAASPLPAIMPQSAILRASFSWSLKRRIEFPCRNRPLIFSLPPLSAHRPEDK
jgi:hypothetical protein